MNKWYMNIKRSKLNPPSYVFKIVWPILYLLIFITFFNIYNNDKCKNFCYILQIFCIHLILNFIWTTLFFKLKLFFISFIDILLMIITLLYLMTLIKNINGKLNLLLYPYLFWLIFALYLNFFIFLNN